MNLLSFLVSSSSSPPETDTGEDYPPSEIDTEREFPL